MGNIHAWTELAWDLSESQLQSAWVATCDATWCLHTCSALPPLADQRRQPAGGAMVPSPDAIGTRCGGAQPQLPLQPLAAALPRASPLPLPAFARCLHSAGMP